MAHLQLAGEADEFLGGFFKKYVNIILPVARFCLVSTFLEDGLRMFFQFNDQARYVKHIWKCGAFIASLFVVQNLIFQIVPAMLILLKKHVSKAVFCLFAIICIQIVMYNMFFDLRFLLRSVAVGGGLLFVLAENSDTSKRVFALLPGAETEDEKKANVLMLAGRMLLGVMMATIIKFDSTARVTMEFIAVGLLVMIYIGFQTKLASSCLVVLLLLENIFLNNFWSYSMVTATFDFKIYDFFQTMSVIGGLLMVVALGPGSFSLDERKKAI